MHSEMRVEVVEVDVRHDGPPDDARVVDEYVDTAESIEGGVDQRCGARFRRDVVRVGDRRTATGNNLVDNGRGWSRVGADTVRRPAEVIDDDVGTASSQQQRICPADAPTGAGDDGNAVVEAQRAQAGTGVLTPRSLPSVPPRMAARSSSG